MFETFLISVTRQSIWTPPRSSNWRAEYQAIKDGTSTVSTVRTQASYADNTIYDLQGHKLQGEPTSKGIYIKNGVKTVMHK